MDINNELHSLEHRGFSETMAVLEQQREAVDKKMHLVRVLNASQHLLKSMNKLHQMEVSHFTVRYSRDYDFGNQFTFSLVTGKEPTLEIHDEYSDLAQKFDSLFTAFESFNGLQSAWISSELKKDQNVVFSYDEEGIQAWERFALSSELHASLSYKRMNTVVPCKPKAKKYPKV